MTRDFAAETDGVQPPSTGAPITSLQLSDGAGKPQGYEGGKRRMPTPALIIEGRTWASMRATGLVSGRERHRPVSWILVDRRRPDLTGKVRADHQPSPRSCMGPMEPSGGCLQAASRPGVGDDAVLVGEGPRAGDHPGDAGELVPVEGLVLLDGPTSDSQEEVDRLWAAEIGRRSNRVLSGESPGEPWDEARRRIESDLAAR